MNPADALAASLLRLPSTSNYRVAFSGGLDSTVLLHLLARHRDQLPAPVEALHIHHGLQAEADRWADQCVQFSRRLGIPCRVIRVTIPRRPGDSLEAQARQARYNALRDAMQPGDILLTAHHADDQAETLLLQLLRGSGVKGLAAMPELRPFPPGAIARPLLRVSREELLAHGLREGLQWIEDPSNQQTRFDRNLLRHRILPELRRRHPSLHHTLSRSAHHCAEAAELLDELADIDLARCGDGDTLSIEGLRELSPARQRNLLRHWIAQSQLPTPSAAVLQRIIDEALTARGDAMPLVHWHGGEVRRFRGSLYCIAPLAVVEPYDLPWNGQGELKLPSDLGTLQLAQAPGGIDPETWHAARIRVCTRHGGERCRPAGSRHTRSLKQLFQDSHIPPWQRERIPLIFLDGQLAAIGDHWICLPFAQERHRMGLHVRWTRPESC